MKILTTPHRSPSYTLTQMCNNYAETHLSGGVLSAFVFPLIAMLGYSMCERVCGITIFCMKASNTACDWFLHES